MWPSNCGLLKYLIIGNNCTCIKRGCLKSLLFPAKAQSEKGAMTNMQVSNPGVLWWIESVRSIIAFNSDVLGILCKLLKTDFRIWFLLNRPNKKLYIWVKDSNEIAPFSKERPFRLYRNNRLVAKSI
jgi:hypothetical protein